jgi:hypothetical protein
MFRLKCVGRGLRLAFLVRRLSGRRVCPAATSGVWAAADRGVRRGPFTPGGWLACRNHGPGATDCLGGSFAASGKAGRGDSWHPLICRPSGVIACVGVTQDAVAEMSCRSPASALWPGCAQNPFSPFAFSSIWSILPTAGDTTFLPMHPGSGSSTFVQVQNKRLSLHLPHRGGCGP